jgi:aminomethyltransferase
LDFGRGDELWDAILAAGEEFDIRPIAPCEARRIEAGIFNYGSDITLGDTPFHVMGLERLVEEQPQDYIGKDALERIKRQGVDRKLVGIELEGDELRAEMSECWPVHHGGAKVGHMTDAVWSPGLAKNIGYVWVPIDMAAPGTRLEVATDDGEREGTTAALPFIDPEKKVPAS